jgi:hypothetical protein
LVLPDAKKLIAKSATTIISVNSQALGNPPTAGYMTTLMATWYVLLAEYAWMGTVDAFWIIR